MSSADRRKNLALSPRTALKSLISKSSDTYSQATTLVLGEWSPKTVKKGKHHSSLPSSSSSKSSKSTGKKGNQIVKVKASKVVQNLYDLRWLCFFHKFQFLWQVVLPLPVHLEVVQLPLGESSACWTVGCQSAIFVSSLDRHWM